MDQSPFPLDAVGAKSISVILSNVTFVSEFTKGVVRFRTVVGVMPGPFGMDFEIVG